MSVLKGFGLALISILLFLSLIVFGTAYTANSTVLNPDFFTAQLDRLDVSALVNEIATEEMDQGDFPQELMTALIDTIDKLEAPVKAQVSAATHDTFDYLLGERQQPDLTATLGKTFLNAAFVESLMAELDLPALTEEVINRQISEEGFPEEIGTALITTIAENETLIKEKVTAASDPVFDYLLGKTRTIDLAQILRNTILTADFVTSLVEGMDLAALAPETVSEQLAEELPEELKYLSPHIDDAVVELESTIKREISAAADPVLDYLLGERNTLSVVISLEPIMESLENSLRQAFLESPPARYAGLTQDALNQLFDRNFAELTRDIPSTVELDETLFPPNLAAQITEALAAAEDGLEQARQDIAEAITEAEEGLEQAREHVSQFQVYYYILIGWLALLVLAIVLINHEVKGATRWLGINFLIYGAITAVGNLLLKNFATNRPALLMTEADIPLALQTSMLQLLNDFLAPLQMLSIGLAVAGVVLIVVSIVYPRLRQTQP